MEATSPVAKPRVGLLVPSPNTIMEQDLNNGLDGLASVHTARMYLVETTRDAEAEMLDRYLPQAVADIATMKPDVTVFGCTSAGALRGPEYDRELCADIATKTGATTISTIKAVSDAISDVGARRVAVLTPYVDELNLKIRESIEASGVEVLEIDGLGIVDGFNLAEPPAAEIATRAIRLIGKTNPDLLFISCTNFAGLAAADHIESMTGVPVMTSNRAVLRALRSTLARPDEGLQIAGV